MMTKALKPRAGRPTPDDALAVARAAAPDRPPAVVASDDKSVTLNLRLRASTVAAITTAAQQQGRTIKQVVTNALASAGIMVAPEDLEDRTPRRRV
jgi:hypothetical protein